MTRKKLLLIGAVALLLAGGLLWVRMNQIQHRYGYDDPFYYTTTRQRVEGISVWLHPRFVDGVLQEGKPQKETWRGIRFNIWLEHEGTDSYEVRIQARRRNSPFYGEQFIFLQDDGEYDITAMWVGGKEIAPSFVYCAREPGGSSFLSFTFPLAVDDIPREKDCAIRVEFGGYGLRSIWRPRAIFR